MAFKVPQLPDDLDPGTLADGMTPLYDKAAQRWVPRPVTPAAISDAVHEWWVYPLVTHQSAPYPRAVFGGIASDGTVVACELDYATGTTTRTPVGTAGVDDHNAPALAVTPGRRAVIMWNNHAQDNDMHIRVAARADDLRDWLPVQTHLLGAQGLSYAQIHRIETDSTATKDVYWVLCRRATDRWGFFTLTVDHATGAHTITNIHSVIYTPGVQCYCSTAPARNETGQQVIRVAFGFNPAAGTTPLYYFEVNTVTGAITSPGGTVASNYRTGTALPFQLDVLTPAMPALPAGQSRRLFYVRSGPASPAVCFADWSNTTPDQAVYKHATFGGGGDPFDGLYLPLGGNAVAADAPALDAAGGWTYETAFRPHGTPSGNLYVMWRWDTGQEWSRMALSPARALTVSTNRVTGGVGHSPIPGTIPGAWTDPLGLRVKYVPDDGTGRARIIVHYSLNPLAVTPTWVELTEAGGYSFGVGSASALKASTSPLRLGWTTGVGRDVYYATLTDDTTSGAVADGQFDTWPKGTTPWTDPAGRSWTLDGGGLVYSTATSWNTTILPGVAGPRVGYNAGSNYIPGMAYPEPAFDDVLYVARRNAADTASTVEEWRRVGSTWESRVLAESGDKLARPAPPVGGGPAPTFYTELTAYSPATYTQYEGNIVRAPRA